MPGRRKNDQIFIYPTPTNFTGMSVGEIVFVIVLVAAFIVLIYKTMTLDPKKKPKAWPLTVYPILYIYRALKGWLIQTKERFPPASPQSPD